MIAIARDARLIVLLIIADTLIGKLLKWPDEGTMLLVIGTILVHRVCSKLFPRVIELLESKEAQREETEDEVDPEGPGTTVPVPEIATAKPGEDEPHVNA